MSKDIIKTGVLNAILTTIYIGLVVISIFYSPKFVGNDEPDTFLIPMGMLMLFVFSAAITGFLVFGRPILWYLDGNKKEALSLLGATLASLFILDMIVFVVILIGR